MFHIDRKGMEMPINAVQYTLQVACKPALCHKSSKLPTCLGSLSLQEGKQHRSEQRRAKNKKYSIRACKGVQSIFPVDQYGLVCFRRQDQRTGANCPEKV
jgi:hypothetical protein